jgi:hypothetical protein
MKCHSWLAIRSIALAIGIAGNALAESPVTSHADSFSKEGLFKADVSSLKDTQLIAHPDAPLETDKNVLWCGTMQLAWNKTIDLIGEKPRFSIPSHLVDLLNQEDFTTADLDIGSYVAIADFERNHVEDEIRAALKKTFHGAASPELIPPKPMNPGPDDFVAYAYLYKNLAFAHPFEDNAPFDFGTKPVKNFGFIDADHSLSEDVFPQVSIYDYKSEDDFIIKLKTKSPGDELILAKIAPGATLQATIQETLRRIKASQPEIADDHDKLAIPKLNFDLRKDFTELEGLELLPSPAAHIKSKLVIAKAQQLVRFQLDEKGAILKSEAVIVMKALVEMVPPKPHVMYFNRPFLILMKRAKSEQPYFALWIGNASLLMPAADKP